MKGSVHARTRPLRGSEVGQGSGVEVVEYPEAMSVRGALLVTAFPTAGLAGTIACRYLVQTLAMEPIGYLEVAEMDPVVYVESGVSRPCLSLYATHAACGVDGKCDQLVIMYSDLTPAANWLRPLARALLDWSVRHKVDSLVTLEGYSSAQEPGPGANSTAHPKVMGITNGPGEKVLNALRVDRMTGLVTGFSAALLMETQKDPFPVAGLVVESHKDQPDARAASALVEDLAHLLPLLKIDPEPLRAEADLLEKAVRTNRASSERGREYSPPLGPPAPGMYR